MKYLLQTVEYYQCVKISRAIGGICKTWSYRRGMYKFYNFWDEFWRVFQGIQYQLPEWRIKKLRWRRDSFIWTFLLENVWKRKELSILWSKAFWLRSLERKKSRNLMKVYENVFINQICFKCQKNVYMEV